MRRVRYRVATSLDGFVSGPNGEVDWIVTDPEMDFAAIMSEFDTLLVGRRTFELMERAGRATTPGMNTIVFSSTLQQTSYPQVTIVRTGEKEVIAALREESGRDIWLLAARGYSQVSQTKGWLTLWNLPSCQCSLVTEFRSRRNWRRQRGFV